MVNPTKMYYSITEVSELLGLKPHILRYWETEFPILHPKKNRAGNRAYRKKDIEIVKLIKRLLYAEGYTIEGAKKQIRTMKNEGYKPGEIVPQKIKKSVKSKEQRGMDVPDDIANKLKIIRDELADIIAMVRSK